MVCGPKPAPHSLLQIRKPPFFHEAKGSEDSHFGLAGIPAAALTAVTAVMTTAASRAIKRRRIGVLTSAGTASPGQRRGMRAPARQPGGSGQLQAAARP